MKRFLLFLGLVLSGIQTVYGLENYQLWTGSREIVLNTSMTGLNIPGNVVHFPYLVRLSARNFDFSKAKSRGEDIRFSKMNGTAIPYEISMWNSTEQRAAIWVKLDTVYGNNSVQKFKMYWGKSDAVDSSNSRKVFDTADGFVAVYHLEQTAGNAKDATVNALDGTPRSKIGLNLPEQSAGISGKAQLFSNADYNFFDMGNSPKFNFGATNVYSISAWVYHTGGGGNGWGWEAFISKFQWLDANKRALYLDYKDGAYQMEVSSDGTDGGTTVLRTESVYDFRWDYVTAQMDGSSMKLFLNERLQGSAPKPKIFSDVTVPFQIGAGDGGQGFNGMVDEVVVSRVARSSDWIKLSFLNQKGAEVPLSIKYPQKEYHIAINDFFTPITPYLDGIPDSIVAIPFLPYDFRIDQITGVISGWGESDQGTTDYIIRAYNRFGFADDTITITLGESHPEIVYPPSLQTPVFGAGGVSTSPALTWYNSSGNYTYFCLQISTDVNFSNVTRDTSGYFPNTVSIRSLAPNTLYYWRVNGTMPSGAQSNWSNWSYFITAVDSPDVPVTVSPVNGEVNVAIPSPLKWQAFPGAGSYRILVSKLADFSTVVKDTMVLDTVCSLGKLINSTKYYWCVSAIVNNEASGWSITSSFTTKIAVPSAVVLLSPAENFNTKYDSITLRWQKPGVAVTKYMLQIATDSAMAHIFVLDSNVTDTTKLIRGLPLNLSFWWRIKAQNSSGWGVFGVKRKFTNFKTGVVADGAGIAFQYNQIGTTIRYSIPEQCHVSISLFDIRGRLVGNLVNQVQKPGSYSAVLPMASFAKGTYIQVFKAGRFTKSEQLVVAR